MPGGDKDYHHQIFLHYVVKDGKCHKKCQELQQIRGVNRQGGASSQPYRSYFRKPECGLDQKQHILPLFTLFYPPFYPYFTFLC